MVSSPARGGEGEDGANIAGGIGEGLKIKILTFSKLGDRTFKVHF